MQGPSFNALRGLQPQVMVLNQGAYVADVIHESRSVSMAEMAAAELLQCTRSRSVCNFLLTSSSVDRCLSDALAAIRAGSLDSWVYAAQKTSTALSRRAFQSVIPRGRRRMWWPSRIFSHGKGSYEVIQRKWLSNHRVVRVNY